MKKGGILGLSGNLGSGKTTFTKGLALGLGIKKIISSPTFVVYSRYNIPRSRKMQLYHFDLYRINNIAELVELGFQEIINNPKNITVIEWAEKIGKKLPKRTIRIKFEHGKRQQERIINVYL